MRIRDTRRLAEKEAAPEKAPTDSKLDYEQRKREAAAKRVEEKKRARAEAKISELEA